MSLAVDMGLLGIAARIAFGAPDLRIYVDLDETLIVSFRSGNAAGDSAADDLDRSGLERADLACGYSSFLRPGAREFLRSLAGLGQVFICTAATRGYAIEVLSAFSLMGDLDGVFSLEDLGGSGFGDGPAVLVDNLPSGAPDVVAKLNSIGGGASHVKVPEWTGDPRDSALPDALSAVTGLA